MFIKIHSAAVLGLECLQITAEVDISGSWPAFQIIGLGDTAVQEAKERIRTAWKNSGVPFPSNSRVVINLAPADVKKEGTALDVPMAIGMFLASQKKDVDLSDSLFVGELALNGEVRPIAGVLPMTLFAKDHGYRSFFIPEANVDEACLVTDIAIYPVRTLRELVQHITGEKTLAPAPRQLIPSEQYVTHDVDMKHIHGQWFAKRALEIAAAGGHNVLLSGPPGSGKTLLASAVPSLLPPLTEQETIEVTAIYSVAGMLPKEKQVMTARPFRSPHHSASVVAMVGGGATPRPGEISLAHRGVLFLDEFPEFPRSVIESLRQPLEDGVINISRSHGRVRYPARCTLIASHNPCPCGFASDPSKLCTCTSQEIIRYQKKMSGPLLDRIDLHIDVPRVEITKLTGEQSGECSKVIRERVIEARKRQTQRFANSTYITNSEIDAKTIREWCRLTDDSTQLLHDAGSRLHLSGRATHRIIKVARTIADLAASDVIQHTHIAEALQFRQQKETTLRT